MTIHYVSIPMAWYEWVDPQRAYSLCGKRPMLYMKQIKNQYGTMWGIIL